jgi:TRAP transporter TAXI family solute receptor
MKRLSYLIVLAALGCSVLFVPPINTMARQWVHTITNHDKDYIVIGAGSVTGVFYPTASAICRFVNRDKEDHNIQCSVESTGGSVYNVNAILNEELDFGFTQTDVLYHAAKATNQVASIRANKEIRAVFNFYTEPMTILARADSGIRRFSQLKGKRVNIGAPGSGQRVTVMAVIDAMGWSLSDFALVSELSAVEQSMALCDNKIDAIIFCAGHPNGSIQEALTSCKSRFIPVEGPQIDKLLQQAPYYQKAFIPGGLYKGVKKPIPTIGSRVAFVANRHVPDHVVNRIVESVSTQFRTFKKIHPAFASLTKDDLRPNSDLAPLHPGADAYYKANFDAAPTPEDPS